jgi:hypothetical protein
VLLVLQRRFIPLAFRQNSLRRVVDFAWHRAKGFSMSSNECTHFFGTTSHTQESISMRKIRAITEILGIPLEPEKPRHIIHRNLTSTIYQRLKSAEYSKADLERDIVEAGVIRRSLG